MIYRVSFRNFEGHQGYEYCMNRKDADQAVKDFEADNENDSDKSTDIQELETPKTKEEIVNFLNRWGSHNDNG